MSKPVKEKKAVFSAEIDSKINGVALIFTFLLIGIFLLLFPNYFGNELVSKTVRWIFISIGALGCIVEFPKSKHQNIKGFDDFLVGVFLISIWLLLFLLVNILWINITSFIILLFGSFGLFKGIIEIAYSIIQQIRKKEESNNDVILLITKIAGIVLVFIQIIKAISIG